MNRNYWLDLFTGTTWDEFRRAGSNVSGFRESRWKILQKTQAGDYLLCYLTGVSRFIGILEIISEPFLQRERDIWEDEDFPCRVRVKPVIELTPETALPVFELRNELSAFDDMKSPNAWTGHFRSSPSKWTHADGEAVVQALTEANENPLRRPVDPKKLAYRPQAIKARIGSVTVPDDEEVADAVVTNLDQSTPHTEIQWILLKLGSDMGFDVWVARNDRGREYRNRKISEIPKMKNELPLQFEDATNRTIELIDVLWLKGNAIVAAFEIESTTSIYSGLLRMSDLISMQPNINIPLYLVAPDERRDRVISEINRPTFSRLDPPLSHVCRFIGFSPLRDKLKEVGAYIRYLKPVFLDELSDSCEVEEL